MGWRDVVIGSEDESAGGFRRSATAVLRDLRSGRAGWPMRTGLSLFTAAMLSAFALLGIGMFAQVVSRLGDEHIALFCAVTAAGWLGTLRFIWAGQRGKGRIARSAITIIGLWAIAIPLIAFVTEVTRSEEFLVGALVVGTFAISIGIIMLEFYSVGGRAFTDRSGQVRVSCPSCGYSLVGLSSCTCPECGGEFTIDAIIRAQDYAVLRSINSPAAQSESHSPAHSAPASQS